MKIAVIVLFVGIVITMTATAARRKTITEAAIEEYEIRVADVPGVFYRLKANAVEETFTVFVFSEGTGAFESDAAINLQFSFEDGSIGLDWVLLDPLNVRDEKKYKGLAASLDFKVVLKEKNGVRYLRTTDGDLIRLCEHVMCDLYGKKHDSRIGLLTRGIQWP